MAHKDRKIRKLRGTRTCGYGSAKKHRGAGSRGGRGMAGSKKHKWTYISKYAPDHFGKRGFKRPWAKKKRTINLEEIEAKLQDWLSSGEAQRKDEHYYVNLRELGYWKLLGAGKPKHKLWIEVPSCSESASRKVEAAGGRVVVG